MVEEQLNNITREKLGITVKCVYMKAADIALAMTSGEYYDMCFTCAWYNDFATNAFDGQFLDITDMVKTETPALYASMPEMLWKGSWVTSSTPCPS
jgi:putative aldouronate transport system substrate-binding protein